MACMYAMCGILNAFACRLERREMLKKLRARQASELLRGVLPLYTYPLPAILRLVFDMEVNCCIPRPLS